MEKRSQLLLTTPKKVENRTGESKSGYERNNKTSCLGFTGSLATRRGESRFLSVAGTRQFGCAGCHQPSWHISIAHSKLAVELPIIGQIGLQQSPESGRMVQVFGVTQLVHQHVGNQIGRQKQQPCIETDQTS